MRFEKITGTSAITRGKPPAGRSKVLTAICIALSGTVGHELQAAGFDRYIVTDQNDQQQGLHAEWQVVPAPLNIPDDTSTEGENSSVLNGGALTVASYQQVGSCSACGQTSCGCGQHGTLRRADGIVNKILGCADPRWTFQADALLLWQGNISSRALFLDSGDFRTVLNANDLYGPVTVGPRVALTLHLDKVFSVEANYFEANGFNANPTLPADGTKYEYDNLAGYFLNDIDYANVQSSAAISSFELNWRKWNCKSVTWLAGFRWVEWREALYINDDFSTNLATGQDTIAMGTGNDLYGAQLGLDAVLLTVYDTVRFNAVAKAGVYGNQKAEAVGVFGGDRMSDSFSEDSDPVAFMGEIGINGTVRLNEHWSWRAGYNFFWLSGVALAASQFDTFDQSGVTPSTIDTSGSVFLNGVNTGFEFIW